MSAWTEVCHERRSGLPKGIGRCEQAAARIAETMKSNPMWISKETGMPNAAAIIGGEYMAAAIRALPIEEDKP